MDPHLSYTDLLTRIDNFDVVDYCKTRNHLSGTVSRLSPYITRGVLDLPTIRDRVLKRYSFAQAEKFIQELAWREYFQKVWQAKGNDIFSDLRFPRNDWVHHDVVTAVITATTGITVIDAALRELSTTGYMHNHARLWTAMLSCNVVKAHWYTMGRQMYYHLLDGDLASNFLSWQWVAGTSASKRYVANQSLINGCSPVAQHDSYLEIPIEAIGTADVPAPLHSHEPFRYTTTYPKSDAIESLASHTVLLYHPWSLDPQWRSIEAGRRILVIEPTLFERFPVSPLVIDFIIQVAKTQIPDINIFVGAVTDLPGIELASTIFSKEHPTTTDWPGTKDAPKELFPSITGYYPSFFSFWQDCLKTLR